jgi:hypothetical protein|mmetsp:Transcript_39005/g.64764  ORF Transcript_39005/g.64764 Transcript_39005/m.64764 type:complete len:86 (+) Transcript_39005:223-480(+)
MRTDIVCAGTCERLLLATCRTNQAIEVEVMHYVPAEAEAVVVVNKKVSTKAGCIPQRSSRLKENMDSWVICADAIKQTHTNEWNT